MEVLATGTDQMKDLCDQTEQMMNLKNRIQRPDGSITWEYLVTPSSR